MFSLSFDLLYVLLIEVPGLKYQTSSLSKVKWNFLNVMIYKNKKWK